MAFFRRLAHQLDRRAVGPPPLDDGATYVETDHGSLRVRRRGSGPAVLVAPDPPNGLGHIEPLVAALAADHDVIAFEPPGFGWSSASKLHDWGVDAAAEVIDGVLEAHDVERAVLVLPCLFGLAGVAYARRHPERVAGLVLSQTCAWPETRAWLDRIDKRRLLRTPVVGQLVMRLQEPSIRDRWYRVAEPDAQRRLQYTRLADRRARKGARFPLASALQAFGDAPAQSGDQRRLELPTVVLWGDQDRSHQNGDADSMAPVIDQPDVRVVPGAGHFPDLTDPQAVVKAVEDVLRAGSGLTPVVQSDSSLVRP